MAFSGGFAGGLAQGIRNGVDLAKEYERTQALQDYNAKQKRDQETEQLIRDSIAKASKPSDQAGLSDLSQVQASPSVDLNQDMGGLQPVQAMPVAPQSQPAMVDQTATPAAGLTAQPPSDPNVSAKPVGGLMPPDTSTPAQVPARTAAGLTPTAAPTAATTQPSTQPAGMDKVTANYPLPQEQPGQRYFNGSDTDRALAGLTAGITTAWDQGRPDLAINMMVQREKLASVHRDQAYGQAMSQYQMSGDPNAFVPFVNHYLPMGLHIDGVTQVSTTKDGTPVYMLKGRDITTGKPFERAVSGPQLQSFIQGVGDPATQKALFAQQAHVAFQDAKAVRDAKLKQQAEDNKPITVGKDQTAYKLSGDGTYKPIAFGSDVSATGGGMTNDQTKALIAQNKSLSGFVFKLNGVDSMTDLGADQRQKITNTIALGENINRINQGGSRLGDANTAQLSQDLISGKATIYPVRVKGGVGYATNFNGQQVLVPSAAVPMVIRQKYENAGSKPSDQKPTKQ